MVLDLWVAVPGSDLARKFVERLVQWIFSCPECARRHACGAQGVDKMEQGPQGPRCWLNGRGIKKRCGDVFESSVYPSRIASLNDFNMWPINAWLVVWNIFCFSIYWD